MHRCDSQRTLWLDKHSNDPSAKCPYDRSIMHHLLHSNRTFDAHLHKLFSMMAKAATRGAEAAMHLRQMKNVLRLCTIARRCLYCTCLCSKRSKKSYADATAKDIVSSERKLMESWLNILQTESMNSSPHTTTGSPTHESPSKQCLSSCCSSLLYLSSLGRFEDKVNAIYSQKRNMHERTRRIAKALVSRGIHITAPWSYRIAQTNPYPARLEEEAEGELGSCLHETPQMTETRGLSSPDPALCWSVVLAYPKAYGSKPSDSAWSSESGPLSVSTSLGSPKHDIFGYDLVENWAENTTIGHQLDNVFCGNNPNEEGDGILQCKCKREDIELCVPLLCNPELVAAKLDEEQLRRRLLNGWDSRDIRDRHEEDFEGDEANRGTWIRNQKTQVELMPVSENQTLLEVLQTPRCLVPWVPTFIAFVRGSDWHRRIIKCGRRMEI